MVNVVIKLLTTIEAAAAECLAVFGTSNPETTDPHGYLPSCNTPVYGGYVTCRMPEAYARNLEEYYAANGSETVELVRVEWPDRIPEDGWPVLTYLVDEHDEDGNVVGQREQPIGSII